MSDTPRIYPPLHRIYHHSSIYMRPAKDIPLPPKIYPRFHAKLSCMRDSRNLPLPHIISLLDTSICDPPRIYFSQNISPFQASISDPPKIYPSLPEYTPSLLDVKPSQKLPLPPKVYHLFPCTTMCDTPR